LKGIKTERNTSDMGTKEQAILGELLLWAPVSVRQPGSPKIGWEEEIEQYRENRRHKNQQAKS